MLRAAISLTLLFLSFGCAPQGGISILAGGGFSASCSIDESRSVLVVMEGSLPEGIPKGYVEFYYLKNEGNPPASTRIFRVECNERLLLAELPYIWPMKNRIAIRLSTYPGVHYFLIYKGTAKIRCRAEIEEGMVTPVRIRFSGVEEEENKAGEYMQTSFTMRAIIERQRVPALDDALVKTAEDVGRPKKADQIAQTAGQEIAQMLAGIHRAIKVQDVEELIAAHSTVHDDTTDPSQSSLRSCYEGMAAQDMLQNTMIDTGKCQIDIAGDAATAGPVIYNTPHMDEVWHYYEMKKEESGRWRIALELAADEADVSFETEGPVCIPILRHTSVPKEGVRLYNSIGMEFVYIKPGWFKMGSPPFESGRDADELRHKVKLTQGFYMQATEVTQGQWKAVMGTNPSAFPDCGDDCPVENVTWDDVQRFIRRLNELEGADYRLPTEAEWEYTARAGSSSRFCFGDDNADLGEFAWYRGNADSRTHPVRKTKPNAWGVYDLHGNVLEWCQDWYGHYPARLVDDPVGPADGIHRVVRGGSWYDDAHDLRSANRGFEPPEYSFLNAGFRLIRPVR